MSHLPHSTSDHLGKEHVLELLDHFEHSGPNGAHLCLVFPFMVFDGVDMTANMKPAIQDTCKPSLNSYYWAVTSFTRRASSIVVSWRLKRIEECILLTLCRFTSRKYHVFSSWNYRK